jgi:hypothetical protein
LIQFRWLSPRIVSDQNSAREIARQRRNLELSDPITVVDNFVAGLSSMRNVSVRLNTHNQIEVRVGNESRTGETYYLGLQSDNPTEPASPVTGTLQLLTEWIRLLSELREGERVFLPFDFSDEYTRWLTLCREAREVSVVFGWANIEGWAIRPSDFSQYAHELPEFMPDDPLCSQTFYLPAVLSDLRHSRAVVEASTGRDRAS